MKKAYRTLLTACCLLLTALFAASCSESYDDWADPQGYDPEEAVSLNFSASAVDAIDLSDVTSSTVALFAPSISLPEGAEVTGYALTIDSSETLEADASAAVSVDELSDIIKSLYGRKAEPRTLALNIRVYVAIDEIQAVTATAATTATVTLVPPASVVYDDFVYVPGDANSWSMVERLACDDGDGVYTGFAQIGGTYGFKLCVDSSWSTSYGAEAFVTYGDGFSNDGSNLLVDPVGFYYIKADLPNESLSGTQVTSMSLIGDAVGGDTSWSTDAVMTLSDDNQSFVYTGPLTAGSFKFRVNYAWDINLGGTADCLVADGANLTIDSDGNYTVTLYPTRKESDNIYYTITKN